MLAEEVEYQGAAGGLSTSARAALKRA